MRVHLKTLGCRLNEAELESWARDFSQHGFEISSDASKADLVVVNTCAVTQEAVKKSRKLMRRSQRENPNAKLVMSGCYASLDQEKAAAELAIDLLIPNPDKENLVAICIEMLKLPSMPVMAMEPAEQSLLSRNRQRAFIKVQDGCRYRCTYCIVTLARGDEQSKTIASIVQEINLLHKGGIQEVVLAGVHLGGYGSDCGSNLLQLVEAVLAQTEVPRIRLGSLEPWDLPQNFWTLFNNPRLMPHLHLPLQSGSDSVLKRMSRRCKVAEFSQLLTAAKNTNPLFNITTDIIVGFPGETEQEWQQTINFVSKANFAHIHIFAFSPREGTKAAVLSQQIDRETKRQRSEQLHQIASSSTQHVLQNALGHEFNVLVEGTPCEEQGRFICTGYTENYLKIQFTANHNPENTIVRVKAEKLSDGKDMLLA